VRTAGTRFHPTADAVVARTLAIATQRRVKAYLCTTISHSPTGKPVLSWHFDQAAIDAEAATDGWYALLTNPKLRLLLMPRSPLACCFAVCGGVCPGYFRRVSGIGTPMRSKAWRCWLVGSVRTGISAGAPANWSWLRVRVPRWASSPPKLR